MEHYGPRAKDDLVLTCKKRILETRARPGFPPEVVSVAVNSKTYQKGLIVSSAEIQTWDLAAIQSKQSSRSWAANGSDFIRVMADSIGKRDDMQPRRGQVGLLAGRLQARDGRIQLSYCRFEPQRHFDFARNGFGHGAEGLRGRWQAAEGIEGASGQSSPAPAPAPPPAP
jgi:hypothetical protein